MKRDKNTAEYLVKMLEDNGVDYIFGYPGEQVLPLYEAIRKSSITHILVRHEQAAVHAADAYARITGKYGVCIATAGPGAMNMVMGVSTAFKDNVPLIAISGDVPTNIKGKDTFQDLDLNSVFKPITLKSYHANTPEKVENALDEIFSYKKQGITGPFYINIPKDTQNKQMNIDHKVINQEIIKYPEEYDIKDTIKSIEISERPLIIVGSGIIYADAKKDLEELIEKTQIPMVTTFHARGIIPETNKLNLKMTGTRGTKKGNYAAKNADLILALGTRLSTRTRDKIHTDNIIQVNTKEENKQANSFYKYNVKDFIKELNKNEIKNTSKKWLETIKSQGDYPERKLEETGLLHPEIVVKTILKYVKDNVTLTIDAGTTPTYFTIDSTYIKPSQMLFSGGLGPMGYSLPASIGAAFARPYDVIIATTGDGSIQMTMEELAVISTYKLPIIIIILNNNMLGIIKQWQDMANLPRYQVELHNPDFVEIASVYNIESYNIDSIDELETKLKDAIKNRKPYLLNINIADIPIPMPK